MAQGLAGKRILIVEDEYFVAADLKRALADAGADVAGPAGDVASGLALLTGNPIHAALLDVNLKGADSFPIADALAERAVPFVFVTGYDDWALPDRFRNAPRLGKPFQMQAVIEKITGLTASSSGENA